MPFYFFSLLIIAVRDSVKKKKKNILESQILHKGVTLLPELMSSKTTLGYIG